jgi:hypothetical protein
MRSRLLIIAFLGLALVRVHTPIITPEAARAAQNRVYLESLRAQCQAMGRAPDCYSQDENRLQQQLDEWMTKQYQPMPPVKHTFKPVTKART